MHNHFISEPECQDCRQKDQELLKLRERVAFLEEEFIDYGCLNMDRHNMCGVCIACELMKTNSLAPAEEV